MTQPDYPYASGDLLEDRHTYFYSEYGGRAFLDAWRAQRDGLRHTLPATEDPPPGTDDGAVPRDDVINTDALMDQLYGAIAQGRAVEGEVREGLARLVKKFEATKRIHRAYDGAFRAIDPADHKDPTRYLRLAEVFEAAYAATGTLPYLNALLKCLDTLSSLAGRLSGDGGGRLTRLIQREQAHVEALADTLTEAS